MKKILTLLLLFTITLFLSGNQVVITQNYNFIVSNQSTFNFSTGALTSDVKYQRTNKIAITNDKVLADTLKYHYAFFWDEADTYLGYYKTNRGVATSGTYLGQVNTQNIPLPLNAYSFALVRYDNDYVLVGDYTIKDLFIDNNLDYEDTHDIDDLYYKTDGNVSSVNNYYYAAGKNLFDFNNYTTLAGVSITQITNGIRIVSTSTGAFKSLNFAPNYQLLPNTQYRMSYNSVRNTGTSGGGIAVFNNSFSVLLGGGLNLLNGSYTFTTEFDGLVNIIMYAVGTTVEDGDVSFTNIQLEQGTSATTYEAYAAPTNLYNLTLLFGVGNEPNLATMNGYYAAYEEYLEYDFILPLTFANQTLSYEVFYFDDGVSSEIEQLGSILIFTLIGFTLMIFGFVSKRRIFNLLAVGAFVVLGFLLIEFVGFIIILFGLIFVNVYYTFFGEL